MDAIKLRRMLHHAMTQLWFTPHHLEYWHFDAPGDRFYWYIKSKSVPWYNKPAFYGNVER
jgi:D-alanyl-D-alanine dipeptidase